MQLNLFQWDLLETGKGYRCLARLEFDQAMDHFSRVQAAQSDHQAATIGLRWARHWRQIFIDLGKLGEEAAISLLWRQLLAFSFGGSDAGQELRVNLIKHLQVRMENAAIAYLPPDLCVGYLALQLGDYVGAESQLRGLIASYPEDGLLYGYLADALWLQGRREIAGAVYATALLISPRQMAAHTVRHQALAAIVAQHGAELAPIYGYLRGVLPLVEQESRGTGLVDRMYELLLRAERSRQRNDHATTMSARRELEMLAPEIFADYLAFARAG